MQTPRDATRDAADPDPDGLAALRSRLYSADATPDDVERYRRAVAAIPTVEDTPQQPPALPVDRRRRIVVALLAAVAVAGVGLAGAGLVVRAPRHAAPSEPSATALAFPTAARAGFVRALESGRSADLSGYLLDHPSARPPQLTTLTRAATEEHSSVGGDTVPLGPSAEADHGGHLTVILVLAAPAHATWRAALVVGGRVVQQAERTGPQPAGTPYVATIAYRGRAATLLSISVPRGTRWDALVTFSN